MHCKCGHDFSHGAGGKERLQSHLVVRDKDYQKFLKLEIQAHQARGNEARMEAVLLASKYAGSLLECPKCSRMLLLRPGAGSKETKKEFYRLEA